MAADHQAIPLVFDQYSWDGTVDPARPLSRFQEGLILSALPNGARIVQARPYTRWDGRSTFPLFVRVRLANREDTVLLRMARHRHGVETEAMVLPALNRLGLPVPQVLAGPVTDPAAPDQGAMTVLTILPGTDLQQLSASVACDELDALGSLLFEGVNRLHAATPALLVDRLARSIPKVTLADELQAIRQRGGPWLSVDEYGSALKRLLPIVKGEATPLVFSNGDFNAGNFLSDGRRLTGIVDFARARFEDPYYGFAKYWTYDLRPFSNAGAIARGLEERGVSPTKLALRLAIACLWTLQREVPVRGHEKAFGSYREHLWRLLRQSLAHLEEKQADGW
jgi:aminoglycoside phosphotransferase